MSYLVLARKWRPQRFDEVVGQRHVSLTLANAIKAGRLSHAYLFAGPRGVGKTSMARILAKAHNCVAGPTAGPCNTCDACQAITAGNCLDVLEIDGASNRGIDDIRQLRESVKYAPSSMRTKVYIIDEVHMLTTDAFNALLKTLEEPPRHVCFIMATTEPLKVPPTILSRCQRFDFGRLAADELQQHLARIAKLEGLEITSDGLQLLSRKAEGSVRDSLTLLDQVAATGEGPFGVADVQEILGISGTQLHFDISGAVAAGDAARCVSLVQEAYGQGFNLLEIADELVFHFRNALLCTMGEPLAASLDLSAEERRQLGEQMGEVRSADALRWLRILLDVTPRMRRSPHARVHLEVALAEMAALPKAVDLGRVLARLADSAGCDPAPEASGPGAVEKRSPAAAETPSPAAAPPDLAQAWTRIVESIAEQKTFLGSCLHASSVLGLQDGRLEVVLDDANGFKREQVERPANRRVILRTIEEVLGRPLGIRLVAGGAPATRSTPASPAEARGETSVSPRAPQRVADRNAAGIDRARHIARMMDGDIVGPAL